MAIDKSRYQKNWNRTTAAIRARAGNRCEVCGIANGALIPKNQRDMFEVVERDLFGEVVVARKRRVVLSISHLDHTPENCDPANLKAMCQRDHLAYDAPYHCQESLKTRAAKRRAADAIERARFPRGLFTSKK
jgi:hypothetical protein